jgi:hypothetical protein
MPAPGEISNASMHESIIATNVWPPDSLITNRKIISLLSSKDCFQEGGELGLGHLARSHGR